MELSDRSRYLTLDLLNQYDEHISAELLWELVKEQFFTSHLSCMKPFSALHCVSYFGIADVANDLIRSKKWDVNHRDGAGLTPLMWAARYGNEEVASLLLRHKHIQSDMPDTKYGRTTLSWAAGSGHEGVVRLFLGPQFINPGSIGRQRRAPEVMSLLFGSKYVNLDWPDDGGQTPLSWAACNGHGGIIKLLLERKDVSPDRPNNSGKTPLSWAALNGHDEAVKVLLERGDVNPDRPDYSRKTPLLWATLNGHDGSVKILLDRNDISPNTSDNDGKQPPLWAALNGHD